MNRKFLESRIVSRIFWVILIAVAWQMTASSGIFSPLIFPGLDEILKAMFYSFKNGELSVQVLYSLILISKGLVLGIAAAMLMSSLCMVSKTFGSFIETITAIAHPLPGIALLPLIILWFGTGTASIIVLIVHSVVWPLILNLLAGFRAVPRLYKEMGQNFGLNPWEIVIYIMFPCSLPYFLSGLKIGWARSWRALISAEMVFGAIGGKGGLGWYIFKQRVFMDTPGMFAGILVIVIIGIIIEDLALSWVESSTVKKWGMTVN